MKTTKLGSPGTHAIEQQPGAATAPRPATAADVEGLIDEQVLRGARVRGSAFAQRHEVEVSLVSPGQFQVLLKGKTGIFKEQVEKALGAFPSLGTFKVATESTFQNRESQVTRGDARRAGSPADPLALKNTVLEGLKGTGLRDSEVKVFTGADRQLRVELSGTSIVFHDEVVVELARYPLYDGVTVISRV